MTEDGVFKRAYLTCGWCGERVLGEVYIEGKTVEWEEFPHECSDTIERGVFIEDIDIIDEGGGE